MLMVTSLRMPATSLVAWAAILAALSFTACSHEKPSGRGKQVVPVVTSAVEKREVPLSLHVVGTVESTGTVSLQSRVDGQVVKVLVHDGDEVKAGQPLIQIDPTPFQLQVRMSEATLAKD